MPVRDNEPWLRVGALHYFEAVLKSMVDAGRHAKPGSAVAVRFGVGGNGMQPNYQVEITPEGLFFPRRGDTHEIDTRVNGRGYNPRRLSSRSFTREEVNALRARCHVPRTPPSDARLAEAGPWGEADDVAAHTGTHVMLAAPALTEHRTRESQVLTTHPHGENLKDLHAKHDVPPRVTNPDKAVPAMELAQALERFNRKERNLLVRDALGHRDAPLRLSASFRQRAAERLGITPAIPEDAWWATDYHIEWLAGALALYVDGESALDERWPNSRVEGRCLVEGNQEDIDLLIAWGNELVLVEVKAYSGFTNEQMTSKLDRLNLLHAHYAGLTNVAIRPLRLHLLIASPRPPQRLKVAWPSWGHRGTGVPWIPLEVHASQPVLAVTRCDGGGQSSAGGDFWRILRL